jgi:NADPH:quinone reductase-like Zn-dependent oxidoreductase
MRAVAVRNIGDTPELMELPTPTPAAGEFLIKLAAASVNPFDAGIAGGFFVGSRPHVFPLVLGVDGAGSVVAVGEGVQGVKPGDVVHGQFVRSPIGHGTFAEYVLATESPDDRAFQQVPEGMSADIAAALPTAGMTAVGALDVIDAQAGQTLLVVGATGGVGAFLVQLAAARGLEVIATARPDAEEWIRGLGATETIDYSNGDVVEQVRKTHPDGIDALIDTTRSEGAFAEYATLVRDGGAADSITFTASPELLASERIRVTNFMMQDQLDLLARVAAEVTAGRLTVPIQRTVTLDELPAALPRILGGGARGKTTVRI